MGGGEVARYFTKYGAERLHSVVFAAAVTPYLMQSPGNSDGTNSPRAMPAWRRPQSWVRRGYDI